MKNWQESRQVFEWLATLRAEQRNAALATVVRVNGSAYRREGAKLAVAADGATVGNVSGGCLELDVCEVAREVIASGIPQLRHYRSRGDEIHAWDLGTGCDGEITILIEPAPEVDPELFHAAKPFAICAAVDPPQPHPLVVPASAGGDNASSYQFREIIEEATAMLANGAPSALRDVAGVTVFFDIFRPPPRLVIVGAGNDARPLARLASDVGFQPVVVDRRPGLLTRERFLEPAQLIEAGAANFLQRVAVDAETYAVVMTHQFADDEQYLRALLATLAPYIGVLGPRQRTDRLRQSLMAESLFDSSRLYGPIGLDLGADGAEQVALAIVAELLAVRSQRQAMSLRDRRAPMHPRANEYQPASRG